MRDTIINAKKEREVNVNNTLIKVSALVYDMMAGNTGEVNTLKLLELYQDINAIITEITAGRLTMTVNLTTYPVKNYERNESAEIVEVKETPQVMTPAERAAEILEKKKRGRPRKNTAPET